MLKSFEAIVIIDVIYFDFHGRKHVCKSGERIQVSQITDDTRVFLSDTGELTKEDGEAFIVHKDDVSFDIRKQQFCIPS